mgnify:CR=1 FL=1
MVWLTIQLAVGLILLLAGWEGLVRGGGAIARGFGVPPVVVGLTVVAFGTSAPEFVVAITGAGGVVFGKVAGANIINIALILGLAAAIRALNVNPAIITVKYPCCCSPWLRHSFCRWTNFWMGDLIDFHAEMV